MTQFREKYTFWTKKRPCENVWRENNWIEKDNNVREWYKAKRKTTSGTNSKGKGHISVPELSFWSNFESEMVVFCEKLPISHQLSPKMVFFIQNYIFGRNGGLDNISELASLKISILKVWFWPWLGRMNRNPRKNQNRACLRKSQNQTSKFKNHRAKSLTSPQQPRTHHLIRLNKMIIF